jgi:hypothetical protein
MLTCLGHGVAKEWFEHAQSRNYIQDTSDQHTRCDVGLRTHTEPKACRTWEMMKRNFLEVGEKRSGFHRRCQVG